MLKDKENGKEYVIDYPQEEKGHLIFQAPSCIIYLERLSDVLSDCPQFKLVEIAFTLGVWDAISFCCYGYLCKIEPQKQPVRA